MATTRTQSEANYREPYRPQYHFSPATQWTNDPNGLVYYEGEYHLFYQYHPHSTIWGPMHWGHAVSPDLLHWTHLPIALYPDHRGEIWSGSAVADVNNTSGLVPGGGLIAIFSYKDQSQGIAYSTGKGRTWTIYAGNPVIPVGGKDFRDPKVFWHTETGKWVLVLAADDRIKVFGSPNLREWTLLSDFGSGQGWHGGAWECPDLFPLQVDSQTRWVLLISLAGAPAGGRGTQYFIGNFDGTRFTNDNPLDVVRWIDYGRDNYAGITFNHVPDGSRIFIGWMNDWPYSRVIPTSVWRGAMTIPRALTLKRFADGIKLVQAPIAAIEHLRELGQRWQNQIITPDQNLLADVRGKTLEILAEFEMSFEANPATCFGFKVHQSADGTQFTTIGYDVHTSHLYVDRTQSGAVNFHRDFSGNHHVTLSPTNNCIKLQILVDWSSVEVFGGDGEAVITDQVFPDMTSDHLELFAVDGQVTLQSLELYPVQRIWP